MENNELERMALYYKALDCYKRRDPESHDEGFLFLQEAAEKGSSDAMKLIGVLKMSGQYDPYPKKDLPSAVEWYRKAAEAGDEEAMYWLSQCYEMGMGVKVSKREAKKWRNVRCVLYRGHQGRHQSRRQNRQGSQQLRRQNL